MQYLYLTHQKQLKIGLIIISAAVTFMAVVTYGNYDAYFPLNIADFTDLINFGDGGDATILGYQSFSAIFCLLLGLSPEALLAIPIFLIPLFLISFLLVYRLSKCPLISALIVCSVFCYNTSSTTFIFWIHSHGLILLLLLLLLFVLFFSKQDIITLNSIAYFICAVLIIASTNYSSYNNMAQMSLLMIANVGVLVLIWIRNRIFQIPYIHLSLLPQFISLTVITGTLVFIFNSFYKIFFVFIEEMAKYGINALDKILISGSSTSSYPSTGDILPYPSTIIDSASSIVNESILPLVGESISLATDEILSASVLLPYYLSTETSGPTVFGILRYLIIVFAIILYCLWMFKQYIKMENINPLDVFITAFLLSSGVYIFIRVLFIGQPTYGPILYPGVLIIARLYAINWNVSLSKIGRILGIGFIITSLTLVCGFVAPNIFNEEPRMIDAYPQTVQMGEWSYRYSTKYIIATDVYSRGTMCMSLSMNHIMPAVSVNKFVTFAAEGRREILALIHPEMLGGNRDLVINYLLPYISAGSGDWVTLVPWLRYENRVVWSLGYNVVCTNGGVEYMVQFSPSQFS